MVNTAQLESNIIFLYFLFIFLLTNVSQCVILYLTKIRNKKMELIGWQKLTNFPVYNNGNEDFVKLEDGSLILITDENDVNFRNMLDYEPESVYYNGYTSHLEHNEN